MLFFSSLCKERRSRNLVHRLHPRQPICLALRGRLSAQPDPGCNMAKIVSAAAEPPTELQYALIGAGLTGLTIASRLPEEILKRLVVIDDAGGWLRDWGVTQAKMARKYLRTPVVLSPHPRPGALFDFIKQHGTDQDLLDSSQDFATLPSVACFEEFCQREICRNPSFCLPEIICSRVTHLSYSTQTGFSIQLSNGHQIQAAVIIHTCSPSLPVLPRWAKEHFDSTACHFDRKNISSETLTEVSTGCIQGDCKSELLIAHANSLPEVEAKQKKVLVVGGGMVAAELALKAVREGAARVALAIRHELRVQEHACQPAWMGNKLMEPFRSNSTWQDRMRIASKAGTPASINKATWEQLQLAAKKGLQIVENFTIDSISKPTGAGGYRTSPEILEPDSGQHSSEWDIVWLATGVKPDVTQDPVLAEIMRLHPAQVVADIPCLSDSLSWPGIPLFLAGRVAMLQLGPTAGELSGDREAARLIGDALGRLDHADRSPLMIAKRMHYDDSIPVRVEDERLCKALVLDDAATQAQQNPKMETSRTEAIHRYSWQDEGFKLKIHVPLEVPVCSSQDKLMSLQIDRLYSQVIPGRCTTSVRSGGRRVLITLHKVSDQDWRFLKA